MHRTISILTLGFLVLTGCPGDDSGTTGASAGSTGGADSTAGPGTDTNPPGTTMGDSADTTEGATTLPPGTTTDEPGTTTDTPGTTTDMPGTTTDEPGTTTNGGEVCAPDPADDDCAMCVKGMCCMQLEACDADPEGGCQCFQECAEMNPGVVGAMQCGMDCNVDPLAGGTPTGDLGNCTLQNCGFGICF
jgi:hypothetical protein